MMTLEEAKARALQNWGPRGSATILKSKISNSQRFIVGMTTLPARLGGHITAQFGGSWVSFEEAFSKASEATGFEGDDAIDDEA